MHVLHRNISLSPHLTDVVHAANIGVRDLPRDTHLASKAGHRRWIISGGFWQELERNRLLEREIVGAVDLTHSTLAQQTSDSIAVGKQRTRRESAFDARIRQRRPNRRRSYAFCS